MPEQNPTILTLVLDASAPDQEYWLKGSDAFHATTGTDEEAYYAALDASAPDQECWLKGYQVLVEQGAVNNDDATIEETNRTLRGRLMSFADRRAYEHWSYSPLALAGFIGLGLITVLVVWWLFGLLTNLTGVLNFLAFVAITLVCVSGFVMKLQSIRKQHGYYTEENDSTVHLTPEEVSA